MRFCTIVARNYRAYARVLAESLAEQHPGAPLTVLVVDGDDTDRDELFEVLLPDAIGIDPDELRVMAGIYTILEMSTAVKPWLLGTLLERGGPVTYLDPDIRLYAPLDELEALAVEHQIVLTPHTLRALPDDGRTITQTDVLQSGSFNLGFVAVGPGAEPFLDWWRDRLRRDCVSQVDRALFVDQRWVDLVPGHWRHTVWRDPGANVAYWNAHERADALTGAIPLRFFHFSGYDADRPHVLSKHQGPRPRVLLSEHAPIAALCRDFADALQRHGHDGWRAVPYGWGRAATGLTLDERSRRIYRDAVLAHEAGVASRPPGPFDADGGAAFQAWLQEPVHPGHPHISRWLHHLHDNDRALAVAFPDLTGPDAGRFLAWAQVWAAENPGIAPADLVPTDDDVRAAGREPARFPGAVGGVNVAGYLRAESGVGEGARLLIGALDAAAIPHATVVFGRTESRQQHDFLASTTEPAFDTSIVCVNADQMELFVEQAAGALPTDGYRIGMWAWEVEDFPERFRHASRFVDEIWLGSRHAQRAVAAWVDKPVLSFPLPVALPDFERRSRSELGLPSGHLFLFCFDFDSVFERKNPLGLVEAFSRAFTSGEGPVLVIKSVNGDRHASELERLRLAIASRPDIVLSDGYVSRDEQLALMASCDAYVSLHRSEGFGLTMAEAMLLAKPVIATGYSGNLEYMTPANSHLVPWDLVRIGPGHDPYPPESVWAEPDLDEAARLMRLVWQQPDAARALGARAADEVADRIGPTAAARFLRTRLALASGPTRVATPSSNSHGRLPAGPDVGSATNKGAMAKSFRRVVLRVLRHYDDHRNRVDEALLGHIDAVDNQVRAETVARQQLIDQVSLRFDALERDVSDLDADRKRIWDELSAEPYLADADAWQEAGPDGRLRLGFDGGEPADGERVYAALEDVFRGPEDVVVDRMAPYGELLADHGPVLDIGCGRGELLAVLAKAGVAAEGIDLDPGMVERARGHGFEVLQGDGLAYLRRLPDASLGAITAMQVIEHLPQGAIEELYREAHRVLRPGGLLVTETVNPHSPRALKAFWMDLTHVHPVFPEMALAVARAIGFGRAHVLFPHGTGDLAADRLVQGEYALVATRGPSGA